VQLSALRQAPLAAAGGGRSQGAFQGTARTLAGDGPAQQAGQQPAEGTPPGGAAQAPGGAADPQQPIVHTIAFYSNGIFTVDDGRDKTPDLSICIKQCDSLCMASMA
jgi:hypothetical protein